ncbi:hypothetical protein F511_35959 [Dorcoceras hygrometricum]|uniref:Uncharacterized protein n=1 Tax=Dorcoceras hygrometricum TaxID=472368 RepID=A0A2Z7A8L8_9LAMI|nr:hypothetical protein F511_35959 [Dorcoceras hygrometricum]
MVVDLIGIYELKGPYCTLSTTNWFLQALSVIPRCDDSVDHHRAVVFRRDDSADHHNSNVGPFRHDNSVGRSQRAKEFISQGIQAQYEMAPFVPRTRAAAAIHMKQIALDNHSRTIRRLRAKLATERRFSTIIREELDKKIISLRMSQKIARLKAKKQYMRESHSSCHQQKHIRIQEIEGTVQEQALTIDALTDENTSLLQAIQDLQGGGAIPFEYEPDEYPEGDPEEFELGEVVECGNDAP